MIYIAKLLTGQDRAPRKKKKYKNANELKSCVDDLLQKTCEGKLPNGEISKIAAAHGVSRYTIGRVWKKVKDCLDNNRNVEVKKHYKGRCGREPLTFDVDKLMSIPLKQRCNLKSLAAALGISKSTAHRLVKWGKIRRHNNCLKPHLTRKNMIERIKWCYNQLQPDTIDTNPMWKDMYNVIHVDEKWFISSRKRVKFYLAPAECAPHRTIKNKNYITKTMFLVAVARPRFNEDGICTFDGKIGCFPIAEFVPAKRSSIYRQRGTPELKPIKKITREVIREKFVKELIPAIKRKWPLDDSGEIFIQQDNATPHMKVTDEDFEEAACSDGFRIKLMAQPPNSPDLNVLDLGFFRAIQEIQHERNPKNITELVDDVKYAYEKYDPVKLNRVFLTLQSCLTEVLKSNGNNNYNIPHIRKEYMERRGELPITLGVSKDVLGTSLTALHDLMYSNDDDATTIKRNIRTRTQRTVVTHETNSNKGGHLSSEQSVMVTSSCGSEIRNTSPTVRQSQMQCEHMYQPFIQVDTTLRL